MNLQEVCLSLLAAESEAEVLKIVDSVPLMQDSGNWKPLDGRGTNFNVISNQASDGGKALTELMTNMVDAVLMRHALEKEIDPKGSEAPKTMYEAVDSLVHNIHGGRLINLEQNDKWLKEFSRENLVIGITGAKTSKDGRPCYTFVDNGEGQNGNKFEETFLSLSASTKKEVKFVQGQFNMGSSGVLGYCGRHWFKLIVSRRYDEKGDWAWTIIRKKPSDTGGLPIAEFFIVAGVGIPTLNDKHIYPFTTKKGNRYEGVMLKTGTVVKLFDYQIGVRYLNVRRSRDVLNENLVETILPFRIFDFRQTAVTKSAREKAKERGGDRAEGVEAASFYGMEYSLLNSRSDNESETMGNDASFTYDKPVHVGEHRDPELGTIAIRAIRLNKEIPTWLKHPHNNNRVYHVVNGQVQYKQTRGFLTYCKLPALKDRVVVIIDSSKLSDEAHNGVWKGDREHIRSTIMGEKYSQTVKDMILKSEALKKIQKEIAEEEYKRSSSEESNKMFQKLVDSDPTLANLLSNNEPKIKVPNAGPGKNEHEKGKGSWDGGKYSPTFVRVTEGRKGTEIVVKMDTGRCLRAQTDAENEYLGRSENTGRVCIDDEIHLRFAIRSSLNNGTLSIHFYPNNDNVKPGDKFTFTIGLFDDGMPEPVVNERTVTLVVQDEDANGKKGKNNDSSKPNTGDAKPNKEKAPKVGLPNTVLLRKKENTGEKIEGYEVRPWPDGFNEYDGGQVSDLDDENVLLEINYDNAFLIDYQNKTPSKAAKLALARKYIVGMQILMMGFEQAQRARSKSDKNIHEHADEFRRMAARGAASTVLAVVEGVHKIVDMTKTSDDDDLD